MPEINSLTTKTNWDDTDSVPIADAGGVVKRYLLSVLRKIIPATDSTTAFQVMHADNTTSVFNVDTLNDRVDINASAFQVMKADNTTAVFTVDTVNSRVGINTSVPSAKLHSVCDGGQNTFFCDTYIDSANGSNINLRKARGSVDSPSAVLSGDVIGRVYASGYDTVSMSNSAYINMQATENWGASARGTFISLVTTRTGTTTNNTALMLNDTGTLTALITYSSPVGGTNRDLYIDSTGLIGYVSSIRESKTEIEDLGDTSWIYKLIPRKFFYRKKDEQGEYTDEKDGELQYGLVYDEVEKVNPDLCFFDIDENGAKIPRGVNYSKLVPALLDQVQKQNAKIADIEARLEKAGI